MRSVRAFMVIMCMTVATSMLPAGPAHASAGGLDTSFSGDGIEATDFGGSEGGSDVAMQADGKIVVVGTADEDVAVVRYEADGSLDDAFSGDGVQKIDFGGQQVAVAVAIQEDGKIVTAGSLYLAGNRDFAVARLNIDGSLDTTFSGIGMLTTDFGEAEEASDVAIQSDGKIVVVGSTYSPAGSRSAIARYNTDGSLDVTFSGDGKQTTDFGSYHRASSVVIQPDGKIVTAGATPGAGSGDFALVRYALDGSLDVTFSGDGLQVVDFAGGGDQAEGVALQADGKIVAAGTADYAFGLARLTPDGSLDASFSGDGRQTTSFATLWGNYASDVAVQPDGRIVVVGTCCIWDLGGAFGLARFNPDGSLDSSFSGDGMQETAFEGHEPGTVDAAASAVAIQTDGKIVVAGSSGEDGLGGSGRYDFALARYHGTVDAGTPPANTSPPMISGAATEGATLTATAGAWAGSSPIAISYQWRRCDSSGSSCADIPGATTTTLVLTSADVGHAIRVRETAVNTYGSNSVESTPTAPVTANPGTITGTVRDKINGSPIKGATVQCATGYSAKTANNGTYTIANVPSGTYMCTASANRYQPGSQAVTVTSGQTATVNFSLARK